MEKQQLLLQSFIEAKKKKRGNQKAENLIRPSVKENMCFCLYAKLHFQYNSSQFCWQQSPSWKNLDIKMLKRVGSDSKVFNILSKIDDKESKSLTEQRHVQNQFT